MKIVTNISDEQLLRAIKSGNDIEMAIHFLYESFFGQLSTVIISNKGDEADARDVFQDVVVNFIDIVKNDQFRQESSIKTFLTSMMRYTWLNEMKKRGRAELRDKAFENGKDAVESSLVKRLEVQETKRQLMGVLEMLGDTCKKILTMFYYDNLSFKEILDQTAYGNEQVVRNKKHKCLQSLTGLIKGNQTINQNLKESII